MLHRRDRLGAGVCRELKGCGQVDSSRWVRGQAYVAA